MNWNTIALAACLIAVPAVAAGCWVPETSGDEDPGRLSELETVKVRRVISAVRILVQGDLYPAIRTLELRGTRDLGLISHNQTHI